MRKRKPLDQQVIVVFGASSGLGRATALAAARRGAKVVAAARDAQALSSLATELGPYKITIATADAANADEVAEIPRLAVSSFGRIDTWAHVAAIGEYARFEDMTP